MAAVDKPRGASVASPRKHTKSSLFPWLLVLWFNVTSLIHTLTHKQREKTPIYKLFYIRCLELYRVLNDLTYLFLSFYVIVCILYVYIYRNVSNEKDREECKRAREPLPVWSARWRQRRRPRRRYYYRDIATPTLIIMVVVRVYGGGWIVGKSCVHPAPRR